MTPLRKAVIPDIGCGRCGMLRDRSGQRRKALAKSRDKRLSEGSDSGANFRYTQPTKAIRALSLCRLQLS
jgi:hypothetical protein